MLAGGVVVAVLVGAGIFMSGRSKSPAPAETTPTARPSSAPQASVPVAAAAASEIDRQWLNQLMALAANNDWGSVQAKLEQTKPAVPVAVDKAAARQVNTQALNALRSGDVQGAATLFTQAATQDPGDSEIQNNLGYAYLQAGRLDEARQHLLQTLQLAPTRAQAWLNTADLFAQSGNAEVAQSALKLAVFFATDRAKALASLSREENLGHEQFKAAAKAVVAQADSIPAYKR
jgi:tetratricopeptide (TPR) repeat protein